MRVKVVLKSSRSILEAAIGEQTGFDKPLDLHMFSTCTVIA